jgi:hypothetical protein
VPLHDPGSLLTAWRRGLADYPAARRAAISTTTAARCATAGALAEPAELLTHLVPTAADVVHAACAGAGVWYPGAKWHGLRLLDATPGADILHAVVAVLGRPGRLLERVGELARLGPAPTGEAADDDGAASEVDPLQLLNAGADAVGGRMLVARRRGDVFAFAHYAHRAVETALALAAQLDLEPPAGPLTVALELGCGPQAMAEVQTRLAEAWSALLPAFAARHPAAVTAYAVAGLSAGRR